MWLLITSWGNKWIQMGDELKGNAHMPKTFSEIICWVFVLLWGHVASTVLVQSLPLHFSERSFWYVMGVIKLHPQDKKVHWMVWWVWRCRIVVTNKVQGHNQDIIKNNVHLRMSKNYLNTTSDELQNTSYAPCHYVFSKK